MIIDWFTKKGIICPYKHTPLILDIKSAANNKTSKKINNSAKKLWRTNDNILYIVCIQIANIYIVNKVYFKYNLLITFCRDTCFLI